MNNRKTEANFVDVPWRFFTQWIFDSVKKQEASYGWLYPSEVNLLNDVKELFTGG